MTEKRSIDRRREAAMSVEVGADGDTSPITGMITIGGILHIVKSEGIYEIRLADEIDPQRVNPNIPNTQRRVLRLGSDSELVGRTLLTAKKLFDPKFVRPGVDCVGALSLAFEALKDLGSMSEIWAEIARAQEKVVSIGEFKAKQDGSLVLQSIENIEVLCKTFSQKADHTLQSLISIVRLFYGNDAGRRWFESLTEIAEKQYGLEDPFSKYMRAALPFLRFVRNMRNCVEHPQHDQKIVVTDFALGVDGKIVPPTIEVVHKQSPQSPVLVVRLIADLTEHLSKVFETMIAFICDRNMQAMGAFDVQVVELSPESRTEKHVRFSYGMVAEGVNIPIS
jgi:hypothetical protein